MSQRALALAVRDELLAKLVTGDDRELTVDVCDVVPPPGKPPAVAGEMFIAVWEGGFANPATECRDDEHRINITITRRVPFAPYDREAQEVIHDAVIGLEILGDTIATLVAQSYNVMNRANKLIVALAGNRTVYGFAEPLRFLDGSRTEEKGGDWFHGVGDERMAGRAMTLFFGKAKRVQSHDYQA